MSPLGTYAKLLRVQGSACFYCALPLTLAAATRDHVVPRSAPRDIRKRVKGWHRNIVLACAKCNNGKGNRLPTDDEKLRARALWKQLNPVRI